MKLIDKHGKIEIWRDVSADEFYVYGVTASGDPRICPSIGMAREVATGALQQMAAQAREEFKK